MSGALTQSPALQLLDMVWRGANRATEHSWERLNHAMRAALNLAIGAGLEFAEADFDRIREDYRPHYWWNDAEWAYTQAILVGNGSAIKSFERMSGRQGFIADNVDPASTYGAGGFCHLVGVRKRERLHVGARFPWKGATVRVTSFADDSSSLTACSYKDNRESKIARRFTITRDDILADRAERRAAAKAEKAKEEEPAA